MSTIQEAIKVYRQALPDGELMEFALQGFDRTQIPCRTATFFPADGRTRGGIGYGTSDEAALVGALGELTEEFSASRAVSQMSQVRGSFNHLCKTHRVLDPLTLCLDAGVDYSHDTERVWVEVRRWPDGESTLVPLEFIATYRGDLPSGYVPLVTPITNGLGAGLSLEQALCHGILELLQRDGNSVRYRALASPQAIDLNTIDDAVSRDLIERFSEAGVDVRVKVAATDFDLCNLYVVGFDRDESRIEPVKLLAGGEACHPVREVALQKALLEFASSRARLAFFHGDLERVRQLAPANYLERMTHGLDASKEEQRALEAMRAWLRLSPSQAKLKLHRVLDDREKINFQTLPTTSENVSDKAQLLKLLHGRLSSEEMQIYYADFSDQLRGAHAVKVLVPGLEVETMSYGRIGERNVRRLIHSSRDETPSDFPALAGVGSAPPSAERVLVTDQARERLGGERLGGERLGGEHLSGEPWFDRDVLQQIVGDLYCLYREPSRHVAAM